LQSFHHRFPEFYSFIIFLKILENKVSRKIPEKSFKIFMSKMGQRGTWETSGGPTTPPHHQGRGPALAAPTYGEGGPRPLTYLFLPRSFSLPKTMTHQLKLVFLLLSISIF
jgi:hypothetical protein